MNPLHSNLIRCFVVITVLLCASQKASGENFMDVNIKFSPSAVLTDKYEIKIGNYKHKSTSNEHFQTGNYKGVQYRFYKDGSGSFGSALISYSENWSTSCKQDAMEDYRYCFAHKDNLYVWVFDNGKMGINIGTDHFPGTGVQLRIGCGSPYKADKNGWWGVEAGRILQRLLKAQKVTTRYQEWPNRWDKDKTTDLFGLSVVYEYMKWAVHGQKQRELDPNNATDNPKKSPSKIERTNLIRVIQFTLNLKGFNLGEPDGLIGTRTLDAIKTYQTRNELASDGKPSMELLNHMLR